MLDPRLTVPSFDYSETCHESFQQWHCDEIEDHFEYMLTLAGEEPCASLVQSALERWNGGNFRFFTSGSVHGYADGDLTGISSFAFSEGEVDLTIIHEEVHHQYPTLNHEQAEHIAYQCARGTTPDPD